MTEKHQFNAEVGKILHLVIHSLYTNKDIFLRELVSNSSDAIDKLRYLSLTDSSLLQGDSDYKIKIIVDEQQHTITIQDNGIGMDYEEIVNNLGTIAKSGTQNFMEQLTGDAKKDTQLIGQFGVGFYSSFMVADEVVVYSQKANSEKTYIWISQGAGEFTVEESTESFGRGTKIILKLREDCHEYLDKFKIKYIINTYSDHINFPIIQVVEDKEEVLNTASALWTRSKSEISEEQYKQFYHNVAHAYDDPWVTLHNKNEGTLEFTNLLYVPSKKPFDLYHPDRKARIKLYVKKVFISEQVDLIPAYLRFVRGIVDSEDLPLNISRETLQHNAMIDKIKRSLTKKLLSEFKKKLEADSDNYNEFWDNFGPVVKEGLCEGGEFRDDILSICKFATTASQQLTTLEEYMGRMKEGQQYIYYLIGDDIERLKNSPQLEGFKSKDIEVLLLADHVDGFWVNVVYDFKEKEMKSITRADIDLTGVETDEEQQPKEDINTTKLIEFAKELFGDKIKEVKISKKLTDSPACITVPEGAMDIKMERFLMEQKQLVTASPKIFELNDKHPIIINLAHKENFTNEDEMIMKLLYDQACIVEGEMVGDITEFVKSINLLLEKTIK